MSVVNLHGTFRHQVICDKSPNLFWGKGPDLLRSCFKALKMKFPGKVVALLCWCMAWKINSSGKDILCLPRRIEQSRQLNNLKSVALLWYCRGCMFQHQLCALRKNTEDSIGHYWVWISILHCGMGCRWEKLTFVARESAYSKTPSSRNMTGTL